MRIRSLIALTCAIIAFSGCQKSYKLVHGSLPSSVKVKKLDMNRAAALTVMPYSVVSKAQTRAGEDEFEDRLFIVDLDGNTKLASFTIEDSKYDNTIWKEIRKTLTLVPTVILPLSQEVLLLNGVRAVHEYTDWGNDAIGNEEKDKIYDLLVSLEGSYLLRVADGALFKSPIAVDVKNNLCPLNHVVKTTADGKNFIFTTGKFAEIRGYQFDLYDGINISPWILSDKGDHFELKYPSEILQEDWLEKMGIIVTQDNRIIELIRGKGVWSYDLELNPFYLNYSEALQKVFERWRGDMYHALTFDSGRDSYIIVTGDVDVDNQNVPGLYIYKLFLNGNELDCSFICSGEFTRNTFGIVGQSKLYPSENGIIVLVPGVKIIVDVKNGTYVREAMPDDFPQEWNSYDENGIAYMMTDNAIEKYNLNTKEKTSIPIHWEQVDFGGFVTYQSYYCNGVFSVSGRTRTAQSVTVLIDAETGNVSLTDLAEYSGSVIKTYYRLN